MDDCLDVGALGQRITNAFALYGWEVYTSEHTDVRDVDGVSAVVNVLPV